MTKFKLQENVPLSSLTTFQVGGRARYYTEVSDEGQLVEVINFAQEKKLPMFVIGGGSDILISDKGFKGLVIRYKDKSVKLKKLNGRVLVTAGAGLIWDNLVEISVSRGLQGIECMSGIPGSVGAAPIQNIGAYGQELGDVFVKLFAFDLQKKRVVVFDKKKCRFAYRESIFKKKNVKGRYLITKVSLKLNSGGKPSVTYESLQKYLKDKGIKNPNLVEARHAVLQIRGQKLEDPKTLGNAGSFFKNPIVDKKDLAKLKKRYPDIPSYPAGAGKVKLFAGWLIEQAGWKGKRHKNAMVSRKNALVLTNPKGRAKASEVKELAEYISNDIYSKFKIRLEPEVQFIGFD